MFQGAKVRRSTNQSIPNNADTAISFDTAEIDVGGFWSAGAPTLLTVPAGAAGVYLLTGTIVFASSATGVRILNIELNSTTRMANAEVNSPAVGNFETMSCSQIVRLAAGDTITLVAFQTSGGALNALAQTDYSSVLGLSFLGS